MKLFSNPLKLGFFKKITVHILLMTLLTGTTITAAVAYQFRREIYRLEFDTAYTVYAATISYFAAHYHQHTGYVARNLDFILGHRFLRLDHTDYAITHRPRQVSVYDSDGRVIYDFRDRDEWRPAQDMAVEALPRKPTLEHRRDDHVICVSGPIIANNNQAGYIVLAIPTRVRQQIAQLLVQALGILIAVMAAALLASMVFTRQVLSPIRSLTLAAQAVKSGDLEQDVPVVTADEIGALTGTFNDMIRSLERRMDFMHRMQEWTVRIGRQLDTQRLFTTLGEMFARMSMAGAFRLYLYDADAEELEVRLESGAEELLPPPQADPLTRMALKERWTMYLREDGAAVNEPKQVAELAIPLLSGAHRVGVIRIGRKSDGSLYDEDTLTILQTLAQHASVAIDNASLYERLAAQERLAQEMTLARRIQQSMLPREAPRIPGYDIVGGSAPAFEVGGDYFDYVSRNGHCYMLIGDVSGKGVPAALIMSIVRALIHTYLEFETSPGSVLKQVNRNISADLDPEMFVTMSHLQLDPQSHELLVTRAGHEPVLIIHADGSVEHIAPGGSALGLLAVDAFERLLEEQRCALLENDTVLLYTDGVTEARNEADEEFGAERLEALVSEHHLLSVEVLYKKIIGELREFTGAQAQQDDLTLVILRRKGSL